MKKGDIMASRIFIDDIRMPPSGWFNNLWLDSYVARSSKEAIDLLKKLDEVVYISFDHDLGGEDTAMAVVHWIVEKDLDGSFKLSDNFKFDIHSANPVGVENIKGLLTNYINFKKTE